MTLPRKLTRRERQIMDVLYRLGKGSVQDVLQELEDPPSYSSVRTLLGLLEEKGHINHSTQGNRYVYAPAVPRGAARKKALSDIVATFFGGSVEQTLLTLLQSPKAKFSEAELEQMSELIQRAKDRES